MKIRVLNNDRCKCSICGKVFYSLNKQNYIYSIKKSYQCSYSCYLKAKAKQLAKTKRKGKNKLKEQYRTADVAKRTEPNIELSKIYAVENRYGLNCWTRTDDTFLNDPDVIFVRMKRR